MGTWPQPICTRVDSHVQGKGESKGLRFFSRNGTLVDILKYEQNPSSQCLCAELLTITNDMIYI